MTPAMTLLLSLCFVQAAAAWEHVGPRNLFNDKTKHGESGTLADAASPASNPQLIYTGGYNNGASSGILKTTDGGVTWTRMSAGLLDTRIHSVLIHPGNPTGGHVLVGTATGIYESTDYAKTWQFLADTLAFGRVQTLRAANIKGAPVILAGVKKGIASIPASPGTRCLNQTWTVAPYPTGAIAVVPTEAFTVAHGRGGGLVLGACIRMSNHDAPYAGEGFIGTVKSAGVIAWQRTPTPIRCARLALHPSDPQHFIYSNSSWGQPGLSSLHNTYGTTDGGKTVRNLGHPTQAFHVAIDQNGWYYTGAEAGAFVSADGGGNWSAYVVQMESPGGEVTNRIPHDYQGITTSFAGDGVAFPSDQGLFIKPPGAATALLNVNGDMSNNIAIKVSIATGDGKGTRYLVTSMWDWGPVASWDDGATWPIGDWNPHGPPRPHDLSPSSVRTPSPHLSGGDTQAVKVQLQTKHGEGKDCTRPLHGDFWLPVTALAQLHMNAYPHGQACGGNISCGSIVVNGGANMSLNQINPRDGSDACGHCKCPLAYLQLQQGQTLPPGVTPGDTVTMKWSPHPGPPPQPTTTTPHYPAGGSPARFGEGGAAHNLGNSNHVIMLHYNNVYYSSQGGQNLTYFTNTSSPNRMASGLPQGAVAHTSNLVWTRKAGSRSVPAGPVFTIMGLRPPSTVVAASSSVAGKTGSPNESQRHLAWTRFGELRDHAKDMGELTAYGVPGVAYVLRSMDFGRAWNWVALPPHLQKAQSLAVDPTDSRVLYAISATCFASSRDQGSSWSECSYAPGLKGASLTSLHVKDSQTMIALQADGPPLRTSNGGSSWAPLQNFPNVSRGSYSRAGAYSWSGRTFVVYGLDANAPNRRESPSYVYATTDDGDTWVDWLDDLVTMSLGSGVWFEKDFYLTSAGEGIMVRRNAEV